MADHERMRGAAASQAAAAQPLQPRPRGLWTPLVPAQAPNVRPRLVLSGVIAGPQDQSADRAMQHAQSVHLGKG